MRGATRCAQRVKQLFRWLRSHLGRVQHPSVGDPITQLILGILSRDMPEPRAREALGRLRSMVVDYNELRVIPPLELAHLVGDYPDVRTKCEDLSRALNRIFAIEHNVSLERAAGLSRKDQLTYLNRIDGLEAYTRARIRLLGFGQHAVPLDEAMWAYARQKGIVDSRCSLEEAQAFLERQIQEDQALEFFALLRKQAWNEMGTLVRKQKVERILSVPPDRTSRNMLQQVAAGTLEPAEGSEAGKRRAATQPATRATARTAPAAARRKTTALGASGKLNRSAGAAPAGASRQVSTVVPGRVRSSKSAARTFARELKSGRGARHAARPARGAAARTSRKAKTA
jgi:endonuclease III